MMAACPYYDCSCWPTVNASSTSLTAPDTPLAPAVSFVGSGDIGSCSAANIDATASSGSGGRDWTRAEWNVQNGTLREQNLTALANYTEKWSLHANAELSVPSALLMAGARYTFSLVLTNFLGAASPKASFTVTVDAGSIPLLQISSGARYDMFRPSPLSLFADAAVAVCPGEKAGSTALTYLWECSYPGVTSTMVDIDPRYFRLPGFTLNASTNFEVNVWVFDKRGNNNTALVQVHVGQSDLVASIDGGDRNVGVSETLTLDASASYDPDAIGAAGLAYAWACEVIEGSGTCGTLAPVAVNELAIAVGTFKFSLSLSKESHGTVRNATASVVVESTYDIAAPVVISALSTAKPNPSDKLILTGSAGPSNLAFDIEWSLASGSLVAGTLASAATTALTTSVGALSAITNYLVLPSDSLTPGGYYEFLLTATTSIEGWDIAPGYSTLSVIANAPPSSGKLSITPSLGVVLQTAFEFRGSGWVDDVLDLPLLYSFFYQIFGETTEYQIVSSTPSTSYSGALLPQGGGNQSQVVGVTYVADQLGATARATTLITCEPMALSIRDLANLTSRLVAASLESGDVEGIFQAVVASSSVLNSPNCSLPCNQFNRETCLVDGACGSCLDGFVGVASPSNSPCWAKSQTCSNGLFDGNETG